MGRVKIWITSGDSGVFASLARALVFPLLLLLPSAAPAQTELGSEDDLTILGVDGSAADPDAEIKGFTVFGSTQAAYTGVPAGPGNVVINGVLAVSSGAYFVSNSTFPAANKIFINDGNTGQLLRRNAAGYLEWYDVSSVGDNLGDHTATTTLQMGAYGINTSSNITAARYQINGSTVLAILSGVDSLGVGINAGRISTGSNNSFVGYGAGYSNTTGANNSFVGVNAGHDNNGGDNSFLGYEAGQDNTTGGNNSFMGRRTGYFNNTGSYNSFFGSNAGYNNTTGLANSLFGYYAGYYNQTGSGNSILGYEAGKGPGVTSYSSNTIIGYHAGFGLTNGSNNILLGWQTGDNLTTGSRNIIIGYDEDAPAPTTNDYINIGGLLHGDMAQSSVTVYGELYADKFYGDGSGLTGVAGDNLGDHTATQALDLAQFPITDVSSITIIGDGIRITTSVYYGASGVFISSTGAIMTMGRGQAGSALPGARGVGAVDLQTWRSAAAYVAAGDYAVISGGLGNMAGDDYATVAGGGGNIASGNAAVVSGGGGNTASGPGAVVSGGGNNIAGGPMSSVSGGFLNTALGEYSWAGGHGSSSTADGSFTWADSQGVALTNSTADRTWFKNRGGFLVTGSTQPISDGGFFVSGQGCPAQILLTISSPQIAEST